MAKSRKPEIEEVEEVEDVTTTEETAPETAEVAEVAVVSSTTKQRKVIGLRDHTCRIGNDNVYVEKDKETIISETAAFLLAKQGILVIK